MTAGSEDEVQNQYLLQSKQIEPHLTAFLMYQPARLKNSIKFSGPRIALYSEGT
jgi:hypothetical protein